MKALFTLLTFFIGLSLQAQIATFQTEFNNFRWWTAINGGMFNDVANGMPGLEVPINSGNHTLNAANLWIGGVDEEGELHLTAETYCQDPGCQFGPGPLKLDGTPGEWSLASSPYNRFWMVNQDQVETHLAYHDCVNDPNCDAQALFPDGYNAPADFVSWPAMGDSDDGFATYLAPFFDYNGDGFYDANNGDHPLFCGDATVYSIMNDLYIRPTSPFWVPGLGVEVHTQYYTFFSNEPELFNTLFIHKRMINRSSVNYSDMYLAVWNDFDIGNFIDDYVGTDVQRSMIYGYNGDDFDMGSQNSPGYGDDLPMLGMRILGGPFKDANGIDDEPLSTQYTSYANQTTGWGDGMADNERLGLATSLYHSNFGQGAPTPTTDPVVPIDYYNFMRGSWKDGTPMSVGGLGYSPFGNPTLTSYIFPGLSDPLLAGTNGVDPNFPDPAGWTEETSSNPPGDRRMLASSGPFTFGPGEEQYFDVAYIFARDSHEPGVDVLETLRSYADAIVGMACGPLPQMVLGATDINPESLGLRLYPNPAKDRVTLESHSLTTGRYSIYDLIGKVVMQGNTSGSRTEISVSHLPKGLYLVRFEVDAAAAVQKLVVE